ncbi:SAWADEE domain containing homeodomain protein [Klebsormidium nitens]|uniref:SAWADEE domain containing homeodomain protein n=1 Tax=Klebsormidium nitens TaxID=105231 RepID=A0A1Y1HQ70_KLENI|nr:SAWADEE domain containing homeodomain protein [Klebsormidium nitens]|eukprot:GAQ80770.1 SAWADEE domain containing homeodomain protein [Klebsormidium nitens]
MGGRAFRFLPSEVDFLLGELEKHGKTPPQHILEEYTVQLNADPQRQAEPIVSKQLWNWFQNRRHHFRKVAGTVSPHKLTKPAANRDSPAPEPARQTAPQPPQPSPLGAIPIQGPSRGRGRPPREKSGSPLLHATSSLSKASSPAHSSPGVNVTYDEKDCAANLDYESLSTRDHAWYDVDKFVGRRVNDQGQMEMKVRFGGFNVDEDEWVDVKTGIRQRSLPCEASECVGVLPGDLVLCFQEGREQALYFDADVYEVQRGRHDVRGCRCRFKVRYRVDGNEEVVPLRKICRRPETEYRFQLAAAASAQVAATVPPLAEGATLP